MLITDVCLLFYVLRYYNRNWCYWWTAKSRKNQNEHRTFSQQSIK